MSKLLTRILAVCFITALGGIPSPSHAAERVCSLFANEKQRDEELYRVVAAKCHPGDVLMISAFTRRNTTPISAAAFLCDFSKSVVVIPGNFTCVLAAGAPRDYKETNE